MPRITFDEAKKWLEEITPKDRVAVIHDVDPDGMSAAVLMTDYLEKKGFNWKNLCFYRGISNFNDFNLKEFDRFIILDLSKNLFFNEEDLIEKKPTLIIDHHPEREESGEKENIFDYKTKAAICTSRSVYELAKGKEWLEMVGIISDAGEVYPENKELINHFFEKHGLDKERYKEEYIWKFGSLLMFFDKNFQRAFEIMKGLTRIEDIMKYEKFWGPVEEEKEETIRKFYEHHEMLSFAHYFHFEPKYNVKSIIINKISFAAPKGEVFIFTIPKGDGKISVSTRCQGAKYDMDRLLKECTKSLDDAGGGGHPAAAAAWLKTEDLAKFKENVRKYLESLKS